MRQFLIILVILVWVLLGWCYYQNTLSCCPSIPISDENQEEESITPVVEKVAPIGPLLYNWSNPDPLLGENWAAYRDSIAGLHNQDNLLQITGYYHSGETNNSTYDNLGIARAVDLQNRFLAFIDSSRITTLGKLTDVEIDSSLAFESADFRYLVHTENVKEVDNKALIYFPYNSTRKLNAADVETYLNDVAERVTKSGETVSVVGHTDSFGDAASNHKLGLMRANVIKEYLENQGVPVSQIKVESRGEVDPLAGNGTRAGRAKNRRCELTIQ